MLGPSKTIDEVLNSLDLIIAKSVKENDIRGVFAYLYRRTTFEIKKEIEKGAFEDNRRMEEFDVIFANLYLDAFRGYLENQPICESWKISFEAGNKNVTIFQHLLMGMNAHINYDLGIAASTMMKGKSLHELQKDFDKVNGILANLIDEMQNRIERVSYFMFILDWVAGRSDEHIINYQMIRARHHSWEIANELWKMEEEQIHQRKLQLDLAVKKTSELIKTPNSRILRFSLKLIKAFEHKNVGRVILKLEQ